jgi:hypothetical protein
MEKAVDVEDREKKAKKRKKRTEDILRMCPIGLIILL